MALLNGKLALNGVDDVEALAARALDAHCHATRTRLPAHERDDAVAFLVAEAWVISTRWDPGRSRGVSFSTYVYRLLRARCVDYQRATRGRTRWKLGNGRVYERERTVPLSLDAADADGNRLGDTLANGAGDSPEDRATALAGLHCGGDRERDRDFDWLRDAAARAAPGRAA